MLNVQSDVHVEPLIRRVYLPNLVVEQLYSQSPVFDSRAQKYFASYGHHEFIPAKV